MHDDTFIQHPPHLELIPGNKPVTSPIYQGVKFVLEGEPKGEAFYYSRHSNPTVRELEILLAKLQGRDNAFAVASGVAAISTCFFSLLSQGDHVILFVESYKPTRILLREVLARFGVESTMLSLSEPDLKTAIRPGKTKMILLESPTNPVCRVPDFEPILALAKKHKILTLLDNTFSGFHNHGNYPFDIFVHSLTKYASGHGDVMGGVIIGNDKIMNQIIPQAREIGPTLDPHAAFLISRGMKTYCIRYERQCRNAALIAEFLAGHKAVERVMYPGLKSHPDHSVAKKQMKDFGAIVPFELKVGLSLDKVLKKLRLFLVTGSLGSTESLVAPIKFFYGLDLSASEQKTAWITDRSLRLSVGLESPDDLIEDLRRALAK